MDADQGETAQLRSPDILERTRHRVVGGRGPERINRIRDVLPVRELDGAPVRGARWGPSRNSFTGSTSTDDVVGGPGEAETEPVARVERQRMAEHPQEPGVPFRVDPKIQARRDSNAASSKSSPALADETDDVSASVRASAGQSRSRIQAVRRCRPARRTAPAHGPSRSVPPRFGAPPPSARRDARRSPRPRPPPPRPSETQSDPHPPEGSR